LIEQTGLVPQAVTFTGGSSKGFLWPQIIADVLGTQINIPVVKESTSLGAAVCVLMAIGECSSWNEAVERVVRWDRSIEPDLKNHEFYNEAYQH
jgi:autoinducer 2 (AI-2) kinase